MRRTRKNRRERGVSLVETMAGFIILIPIGLAAIDVVTLVSTAQTNEQWANNAARSASRQSEPYGATLAAQKTVEKFVLTGPILSLSVVDVEFDLGTGKVTVATEMQVKVPVPIPFLEDTMTFRADAIQPIVSTPAPL